jgi:uncharacterized protein (DUF2147 family)
MHWDMMNIDSRSLQFRSSSRRVPTLALAFLLSILAVPLHKSLAQPAPIPLAGIWYDDTGDGAVEISQCGERLCGRIVWLKNPVDKGGQPLTDGLNPKPDHRKRPVCGLQVIGDLKPQSNGAWDAGWIYDPKEGKSYDVELKLRAPDRLQVMGYIGTKFLSETFIWTRAPAELKRCV